MVRIERTRPPGRRFRRWSGLLVVVGSLLMVMACGNGDDDAAPRAGDDATSGTTASDPAGRDTAPSDTAASDTAASDTAAGDELNTFCEEADALGGTVPASYVGSQQHVDDATSLADHAPEAIRPQVETFRDYIASDVDPSDPESQLGENQPPEVQRAVADILNYLGQNC